MSNQRVDDPEQQDPSGASADPGQPPPPRPNDDLRELLDERPPKRRSGLSLTAALIGLVVLAGVFFGGVLLGKNAGASPAAATPPNGFPGGGNGNLPGGPGGGGFNPGSGFASGTVTRVDGDTVYVQMADGTTVKVVTGDSTEVRVTQEGSVSDLETGSTVVVQGTASDDGTIAADTISEGTGGFPGGGPGGFGNAPPTLPPSS